MSGLFLKLQLCQVETHKNIKSVTVQPNVHTRNYNCSYCCMLGSYQLLKPSLLTILQRFSLIVQNYVSIYSILPFSQQKINRKHNTFYTNRTIKSITNSQISQYMHMLPDPDFHCPHTLDPDLAAHYNWCIDLTHIVCQRYSCLCFPCLGRD